MFPGGRRSSKIAGRASSPQVKMAVGVAGGGGRVVGGGARGGKSDGEGGGGTRWEVRVVVLEVGTGYRGLRLLLNLG